MLSYNLKENYLFYLNIFDYIRIYLFGKKKGKDIFNILDSILYVLYDV